MHCILRFGSLRRSVRLRRLKESESLLKLPRRFRKVAFVVNGDASRRAPLLHILDAVINKDVIGLGEILFIRARADNQVFQNSFTAFRNKTHCPGSLARKAARV